MTFPATGPLYQLSLRLQKNWAILVNLCKIMCAQVHFHETIDIKPWMVALMAKMQCNTFHYSFTTWYIIPKRGVLLVGDSFWTSDMLHESLKINGSISDKYLTVGGHSCNHTQWVSVHYIILGPEWHIQCSVISNWDKLFNPCVKPVNNPFIS